MTTYNNAIDDVLRKMRNARHNRKVEMHRRELAPKPRDMGLVEWRDHGKRMRFQVELLDDLIKEVEGLQQ